MQGEAEAGVALARRNCELTERLGDVFSRSLALANLGAAQLAAEDYAEALESIEEAERLYREAMGSGGEMEAWRAAIRAEALIGVGRTEEAIELAEWASEIAPRARHALVAAAGAAGAGAAAPPRAARAPARRSTRRPRSPSGRERCSASRRSRRMRERAGRRALARRQGLV